MKWVYVIVLFVFALPAGLALMDGGQSLLAIVVLFAAAVTGRLFLLLPTQRCPATHRTESDDAA